MKRALTAVKTTVPWALVGLIAALWAYDRFIAPFAFGREAGAGLWSFTLEMAAFLPAMFVLVGLFDVWVPRSFVERHVGRDSGPLAILWMVLLGTLQAGPLYGAFPVAVALWRKGTAPRNVFIYLGAFSALKIPMLTFEVAFLGWRFSLVRTAVTLPVFVALAYLLERLLPADVGIPEVEEEATGTPVRTSSSTNSGVEPTTLRDAEARDGKRVAGGDVWQTTAARSELPHARCVTPEGSHGGSACRSSEPTSSPAASGTWSRCMNSTSKSPEGVSSALSVRTDPASPP